MADQRYARVHLTRQRTDYSRRNPAKNRLENSKTAARRVGAKPLRRGWFTCCLVGCTLLMVCSRASHAQKDSDDAHMSPATWALIVHDMPACGGFASKDSGWTSWVLDRPQSALRLPPTANEVVRSRRRDYREWALPDSGGVEIWITDDPAMGMAATRPWKIQRLTQCNHAVADHPGVVIQYSWKAFALAFADPTSPTFGQRIESYLAGYPHVTDRDYARRRTYKLLATRSVRREVERIQFGVRSGAGMTKEDYIELLLEREEAFAARGEKGDAQACAAILKLIGDATGYRITRTEDLTPPERRLQTVGQMATEVIAAAERWKRLREPPPLPRAGTEIDALPRRIRGPLSD